MNRIHLITGNSLDVLPRLATGSVHCVVTSPPYFGLRLYDTGHWEGGDPACDHRVRRPTTIAKSRASSTLQTTGLSTIGHAEEPFRQACRRCGAVRVDEQLGLEATPDAYVVALVTLFREVWRVLRDDGTVWLNLGDSYCSTDKWGGGGGNTGKQAVTEDGDVPSWAVRERRAPMPGLKPKDLIGIPWRVALALQADGWLLRSAAIWHKPNALPESVTDRPTNDYEHVFLLAKCPRYYYDAEAVREPNVPGSGRWGRYSGTKTASAQEVKGKHGASSGLTTPLSRDEFADRYCTQGRNARAVWTIPTEGFSGSHYAVMPGALARRCIQASTSERGVCPTCGAPWARVVDRADRGFTDRTFRSAQNTQTDWIHHATGATTLARSIERRTVGWLPTCECGGYRIRSTTSRRLERHPWYRDHWQARLLARFGEPVPATVLDPFSGAGTTVLEAARLGRDGIGIELGAKYTDMAARRIRGELGMLALLSVQDGMP